MTSEDVGSSSSESSFAALRPAVPPRHLWPMGRCLALCSARRRHQHGAPAHRNCPTTRTYAENNKLPPADGNRLQNDFDDSCEDEGDDTDDDFFTCSRSAYELVSAAHSMRNRQLHHHFHLATLHEHEALRTQQQPIKQQQQFDDLGNAITENPSAIATNQSVVKPLSDLSVSQLQPMPHYLWQHEFAAWRHERVKQRQHRRQRLILRQRMKTKEKKRWQQLQQQRQRELPVDNKHHHDNDNTNHQHQRASFISASASGQPLQGMSTPPHAEQTRSPRNEGKDALHQLHVRQPETAQFADAKHLPLPANPVTEIVSSGHHHIHPYPEGVQRANVVTQSDNDSFDDDSDEEDLGVDGVKRVGVTGIKLDIRFDTNINNTEKTRGQIASSLVKEDTAALLAQLSLAKASSTTAANNNARRRRITT